ncbi:MAG: hypothetical protein ACLFUF_02635 [Opitutales bacterium]
MREIEAGLLNEDFIDFLKSLKNHQVESLLVGGYAVVLHGYHRTTGDIDIWIKPTSENYKRLQSAFAEFGLPLNAISLQDFLSTEKDDVFTFGRPPVAIDILTKVKGLEFDEAFQSSEAILVDGAPVQLLSVQSLKGAKRAAGRHKDLDDLENLA